VYWTRKNEAENAEFSKITSRKQNLKAARNKKLSSQRSANCHMPSGCAIPFLKPGVFQRNHYQELTPFRTDPFPFLRLATADPVSKFSAEQLLVAMLVGQMHKSKSANDIKYLT